MISDRRRTLSLLAGGGLLALAPAALSSAQTAPVSPEFPPAARVLFDLYQGDQVIGQHGYEITGTRAAARVKTEAQFQGRVLGFGFSYGLETLETWEQGRLQQLRSSGELRGRPFQVRADRQDRFLAVTKPNGMDYLTRPDVLPTTYWMSNFRAQTEALDTQRGGILRLRPTALGEGSLSGRSVSGWDMGGDLPIRIYYDRSGTWSGLQFSLLGARFDYRRVV